MLKRVEGAAP